MNSKSIYAFMLFSCALFAQNFTPLEKSGYIKLTSNVEINEYVITLAKRSKLISVDTLTTSVEGRIIPFVKISNSGYGEDKSKLKVLIFAQQHGNEQSGKEGALLLIENVLKPENQYLLDRIDLVVIPQMNPDGSEKNKRRNGNNMDLNRNHLILTEPETIGLHKLFDKYLFEATMDVHEYYPYNEEAEKYGYRSNSDEEIGTLTNINIASSIRTLSNNGYMPFIKNYFSDRNFSSFEYSPGGPPGIDYIRHSTFDINDGRQSFGIQNTFSFIQEGLNGKDGFIDNIKHRAEGQMTGMFGFLEFCYNNKVEIKNLVESERENLIGNNLSKSVAIQLDHFPDGSKLELPLVSYSTGKDTTVIVDDYRPIVKSLFDVERPKGYLIPKSNKDLLEWAAKHSLKYSDYKKSNEDKIEQYFISGIDSMDFERDTIANPIIEAKEILNNFSDEDYIFIPTAQLKNNLIVIALEPKSELGLVTHKKFEYLLKKGEYFPVLKVVN
jgi:hypothetical protein